VGTLHSCHTCLTFRRADEAGVDEVDHARHLALAAGAFRGVRAAFLLRVGSINNYAQTMYIFGLPSSMSRARSSPLSSLISSCSDSRTIDYQYQRPCPQRSCPPILLPTYHLLLAILLRITLLFYGLFQDTHPASTQT
jgi:hypothetical protein